MRQKEQMWVHPSFKKKLKKEAVEKDTTVITLTKELAESGDLLQKGAKKNAKKGYSFKV